MAEVKNLFIKSKMNKDLDDRLVPSGEYRNAINVMISRSEGGDVGALENVLGNEIAGQLSGKIINSNIVPDNVSIIGIYIDDNTDRIFLFLTTYIDNSPDGLTHPQLSAPIGQVNSFSAVGCFEVNTNTFRLLTQGVYLNFSKNSIITGVNVLENLLFWTDNRNQPRKINIAKAIDNPNYYTTEDQISVAKYYPFTPPRLWANENCSGVDTPQPQMKNKSNEANPWNYGQSKYVDPTAVPLVPTNPNPTYDPNFSGDSAFLEDKFVRFSYRFKFDEDEYSIIAPFTQPAFIPKQDGYFALNLDEEYTQGDGIKSVQEDDTYKSTIVSFMENKVDSVNIFIDLPCAANELKEKFLVTSLEILYKESDALAVKVLKKIKVTDPIFVNAGSNHYINWEYQSAKPIQTLPEAETTRVFDRVPIRALAQEVVGNRVIYGNYTTSNPWPKEINYKVGVSEKNTTNPSVGNVSRVEYPNHTLKQNRNYQVGIVLADRFGRQSPVILTPPNVKEEIIAGVKYKNSTLYHPYKPKSSTAEDILYWTGDSIKLLFNETISVQSSALNQGLYNEATNPLGWYSYKVVVKQQEQDYYNVYVPGILDGYLEYTPDSVINTIAHAVLISDNVNKVPRDLKEVGPNQATFSSTVRLWGRVNNIATRYQASATQPYQKLTLNQPYNTQFYPDRSADQVVTIGTLSDMGLGQFKTITSSHQENTVTISDNNTDIFVKKYNSDIFDNSTVLSTSTSVNSIPTGSLVKNYRENPGFTPDGTGVGSAAYEAVFNIESPDYPFTIESKAALTFTNATFYNSSSNPLIVRLSTKKGLGSYLTVGPEQSVSVLPELAVFETTPTKSSLDIFWETSTSGLISELNDEILTPLGPRDIGPEWRWIGSEASTSADNLLANDFWVIDQINQQVSGVFDASQSTCQFLDSSGIIQTLNFGPTGFFDFVTTGPAPNQVYNIKLNPNKYWTFLKNYAQPPFSGNLTFILRFIPDDTNLPATFLTETAQVSNVAPTINLPAFPDVPSVTPYVWVDKITAVNGTANPNTTTQQLVGVLTSQVNILDIFTQVNYFEVNPELDANGSVIDGSWVFSLKPNAPAGTYNLSFEVTDADGIGLSKVATWSITLKQPGLDGQIKFGDIQLPLWTGYYGWFASSITASTNEDDLSFDYTNSPDHAASLPVMTLWNNEGLISKSWSTSTRAFSGRIYEVGKPGIAANLATRSCNNPGSLGSLFLYADGIADYIATYNEIQYPGQFICSSQSNTNRHNQNRYRNYLAYSNNKNAAPTQNADIYTYTGDFTVSVSASENTNAITWYAPPYWAKSPINWKDLRDQHDASADIAKVGFPFGWPYIPEDGDNYEDGSSFGSNNGNGFTRIRTGRDDTDTLGVKNKKNKKWDSFTGYFGYFDANGGPATYSGDNLNAMALRPAGTTGGGFKDWNFGSGKVKLANIKFRTRVNRRFSPNHQGLESGTALVRIVIDHYNFSNWADTRSAFVTNALQDGVLFSNFLIQYRPNSSSPWEEVTDILGNKFAGGIWDTYTKGQAPYGWGSALFKRGPEAFKGNDVRYNGVLTTKDGIEPNMYGGNFTSPYEYFENSGSGYVKTTSGQRTLHAGYGTTSYTKNSFSSSKKAFPQGMALRNYGLGSPSRAGQAVAEFCFAFDKKGDYRFIFDNLRQGSKASEYTNEEYAESARGARPYVVAAWTTLNEGPVNSNSWVGPGVSVTVMDLYNQVPVNGYFGDTTLAQTSNPALTALSKLKVANCPVPSSNDNEDPTWTYNKEESQLIKPSPDNGPFSNYDVTLGSLVGYRRGTWMQGNKTSATYQWYAYLVNTTPQTTFELAVNPNNYNPVTSQYQYLFAKEPVFRYVSKFYTRLWSGTEYIYTPWPGTAQTGFFAFSKEYASYKDNTIPDASALAAGFPEEAGVPFGDERAFGVLRDQNGNDGGLYSTWAVKVESNTGVFLESPKPAAYLDVFTSKPAWYTGDNA